MINELLSRAAAELNEVAARKAITGQDVGMALGNLYARAAEITATRLNAIHRDRGEIAASDMLSALAVQGITGICRKKMPDGSECGEPLWLERFDDGTIEYVCSNGHRDPA